MRKVADHCMKLKSNYYLWKTSVVALPYLPYGQRRF
jgi:hypothetical protein